MNFEVYWSVFRRKGSEVSVGTNDDSDDRSMGENAEELLRAKIVVRKEAGGHQVAVPESEQYPPESMGSVQAPKSKRQRRKSIPPKPEVRLSLWSIMKNCIGKELSKIPMPVRPLEIKFLRIPMPVSPFEI